MNLLQETLKTIESIKKTPEQITFIGSADGKYQCDWSEFLSLADFQYDEGFGAQEVASDLVICFNDGSRLQRYEYDGSEGWDLIGSIPFVPSPKKIKKLKGSLWEKMAEIQERK